MEEFPSNSSRAKSGRTARVEQPAVAPKKVEPVAKVVHGEVIVRKKSLVKKIRDTFIPGDGVTIGEYLIGDVLVPSIKGLAYDMVQGAMDRAFYPDGAPPGRRGGPRFGPATGRVANTNYGAFSQQPVGPANRPSVNRRAQRAAHDFDQIFIESRGEAEAVLDGLFAMLDQYGEVSVSVLYELVGISGQFTDNRWGWTNLLGSRVERAGNGYFVLNLPPLEVLEK